MIVSINGYFLGNAFTGSGQYTLHLLEELRGFDLHVARPAGQPGNLGKLAWEQVGWPRMARKYHADLLHCPYFALPLRRNRPAVVTIHDLIPMVLPAYQGSRLVRAYTWLQARASRSAEAILVDSECSKRDVLRLLQVPEERVHVIYLGVGPHFTPKRSGPSPLDKPYVLYMGSQDVRKNVPALIRAFGLIADEWPDLTLAIAGAPGSGGSLFPDLQGPAQALGDRVRFLGRVSEAEKLALFRYAEVFVFPSLYEGFGLEPLEALACGCPVVCSNASSLPEIVGDAGLLVDPVDDAAIAAGMRQALRDPEPWRAKGPPQAARFRWDKTAAQTAAVYRLLLGQDA
jgi:glycosyltransferase involved in cell wall biosynthesis